MSQPLTVTVTLARRHAAFVAPLFDALIAELGDPALPELPVDLLINIERSVPGNGVAWTVDAEPHELARSTESAVQAIVERVLPGMVCVECGARSTLRWGAAAAPGWADLRPDEIVIRLDRDSARYVGRMVRKWLDDFKRMPFHMDMLGEVERAYKAGESLIRQVEAQGVPLVVTGPVTPRL